MKTEIWRTRERERERRERERERERERKREREREREREIHTERKRELIRRGKSAGLDDSKTFKLFQTWLCKPWLSETTNCYLGFYNRCYGSRKRWHHAVLNFGRTHLHRENMTGFELNCYLRKWETNRATYLEVFLLVGEQQRFSEKHPECHWAGLKRVAEDGLPRSGKKQKASERERDRGGGGGGARNWNGRPVVAPYAHPLLHVNWQKRGAEGTPHINIQSREWAYTKVYTETELYCEVDRHSNDRRQSTSKLALLGTGSTAAWTWKRSAIATSADPLNKFAPFFCTTRTFASCTKAHVRSLQKERKN